MGTREPCDGVPKCGLENGQSLLAQQRAAAPLRLCAMTDGRADSCLTSQDLQPSRSSHAKGQHRRTKNKKNSTLTNQPVNLRVYRQGRWKKRKEYHLSIRKATSFTSSPSFLGISEPNDGQRYSLSAVGPASPGQIQTATMTATAKLISNQCNGVTYRVPAMDEYDEPCKTQMCSLAVGIPLVKSPLFLTATWKLGQAAGDGL
ncbi:hypothetical protein Q8A67_022713 [Cirrhinus molitorella]|uniref:Uncharacterized protein n=1 Tax=Cirrhinus molitorella TaxID=172907 RepID=A0AA88P8D9_9TELE|nr:hypothetical protein Q8A67_022713 [Cirrhinus molitorella]